MDANSFVVTADAGLEVDAQKVQLNDLHNKQIETDVLLQLPLFNFFNLFLQTHWIHCM